MLALLVLLLCGVGSCLDIDPNLHYNQLRFPWGVNFKYNGQLHHNLARVWVVTKFNLPPIGKFHFPSVKLQPDCEFDFPSNISALNISDKLKNAASRYQYIRPYLRNLCLDSRPLFRLMESREKFLREKLIKLVEKDLYGNLQSYRSQGRSKRFASLAISAVTGLVTLAVEGISGYLQGKRNKAMANAMDALHKANTDTYNKLQHYKDDLTLYGTYSLKSTNDVLDTLESMYTHQTSLSDTLTDLPDMTWPVFYQTWGGHTNYGAHLNFHAQTLSHKFDFLYGLLTEKIQLLIKGIATLSKGYLPPELFPPSFLKNITDRVALELNKDHQGYRLAFSHDNAYYDMPLATFSLDAWANIVVTFPVFIVPLKHTSLNLYEIETVPVPINDLDKEANSFSQLVKNKPYFAASDSSYIQLQEPELFRCKIVQGEYFCEETFMVKHTHHHTCESALYFNRSAETVASHCDFHFFHNKTVKPSVLDGGNQLVLANVKLEHSPTCDPKRLPIIPQGSYTLTNRAILCNCTLQADLAYLPSDIGACPDTMGPIQFEERPNIAFETLFQDVLNISSTPLDESKYQTITDLATEVAEQKPFQINLTLPFNISDSIQSLREVHRVFARNLSSSQASRKEDKNDYILSAEYRTQISQIKNMINENHEERFLSEHYSEIFATTSLVVTILNTILLFKVFKDHRRLKTLTATLSMLKTAHAAAFLGQTTTQTPLPNPTPVLCYDPIISGLLTCLSTLSVAIIIWQQWKNRNLCRGYIYGNVLDVKLVIGETTSYIPLNLRKIAGQRHKIRINALPHPTQVKLVRNCVWDTLTIDWQDVELTNDGDPIDLPSTIVVPLRAKFKIREMLNTPYHLNMALCRENAWYDLSANSRVPIHRPARRCAMRKPDSPTPVHCGETQNYASLSIYNEATV